MAVGDGAEIGIRSYVGLGKESTFGTYASATTAVEAISVSFKVERDSMKLETLNRVRDFTKRVQTDQNVTGSIEHYLHPIDSVLMVATAMGGGIATSSQSGIAIHSVTAGNFDTSPSSLSFNVRKGSVHTWRYMGGRPNVLTIAGTIGEPVKVTAEFIFKDATLQSDDIGTSLSVSSILPFVYHQGTYQYAATEGSLTTSVAEPIQGFELTINNNIVSDESARQLGSRLPSVLPATQRDVQLTITQRWDTSTNYNRFLDSTEGAVRLDFQGTTITSSSTLPYRWVIDMPKLYMNTPDPEVGGPGEVLQSEIAFDVVHSDPNTTTGKAIGMTIWNTRNAY